MPANLGDPVIHTHDVSRRETSLVDSPLTSTLNPATQRFTQPCPIRFVRMTGACMCTRSKFSSKILVHSWTWSGPPHGSHVTCKSSRMPISRFSFPRDLPIGLGTLAGRRNWHQTDDIQIMTGRESTSSNGFLKSRIALHAKSSSTTTVDIILGNVMQSDTWEPSRCGLVMSAQPISSFVPLYLCMTSFNWLELKDTVLSKWGSLARPFLRRLSGSTFPNSRIKLTTVYSVNFTQGCPCPLSCCTTAILHVFLDAVVQMIFEGQAGHLGHPREAHVLSLSRLTRVARIASVANNLVCCMDEIESFRSWSIMG